MRTDDEIIARIKALEKSDFFGLHRSYLLNFLPFDAAKDV